VKKDLEQWFFKITDYSDRLLEDVKKLEWPEKIKIMQENWIGKSHGSEIDFLINGKKWPIFTTRADTIYGVTFMVISSQHPRLMELVTEKQKKEVLDFVERSKRVKTEAELEKLDKEGVFTGSFAINPLTKEKVPVYAGNFVLADYGCGMVMAVPCHDSRDFEFACKYNIPIKEVIMPVFGEKHENEEFRRTISAVVHRKKDNKFLIMKWKDTEWIAPVVGGIEKDEDIKKAAEREVLEESGYKTKFARKLGGEIECHFYADHKKIWRHRLDQPVLLELVSEKQEKLSEDEKKLHEAVWMSADEALKQMTHSYNNFGILRYLGKDSAFTDSGILINSGKFSGLNSEKAIEEITKELEKKKLGRKTTNYKIRDWLISRQRYWGTPIPIIYCEKCGIVPVPEKELPVLLPEKVDFKAKNSLASCKEFLNVKCPKCRGKGRRETDTMGGFVDSSWYFLRYCDNKNKKEAFDKKKVEYWMPVDQYIGGAEHAVMHLMYARFFIKALKDLGFVKFDEPFQKLFNQGIVYKDGKKMSKSYGNIVYQTDISDKYGIDTARLFLMFVSSPDKQMEWSDAGVEGSFRIINRLINLREKIKKETNEKEESKINSAIKKVTENIEGFEYPKAIIAIIEAMDACSLSISKKNYEILLKLISPFCPHIAEELWEKLGNKTFISLSDWPKADEKKINLKLEEQEKQIEKLGDDINNIIKIMKEKQNKTPKKAYVYTLPKELDIYSDNLELIKKKTNLEIEIFAVNDKNKKDPENKAGKAKPNKPSLYLE